MATLRVISLLFLFFVVSHPVFAAPAAVLPKVETYDELVTAVRAARAESRERIEQEGVRLAWETGNLIDKHILHHKERADYAAQVMLRLAKDLGTSDRELYYMLEFARTYPISTHASELSWSDYRELLNLSDLEERKQVAEHAAKEAWDRERIRREVLRINASKGSVNSSSEILEATPGKVGTYRVVKAVIGPLTGQLVLDLGFSNYFQPEKISKFKEGDIVRIVTGDKKQVTGTDQKQVTSHLSLVSDEVSLSDLFTYNAYVIETIDGDTFRAVVDLGFKFSTVQTLRLRGLDAPEIFPHETSESRREALGSPETSAKSDGREAKDFLAKQLSKNNGAVLIKTLKSDKYDRYLADVWVNPARDVKIPAASTRPREAEWRKTYINQKLIDKGLAVRVSE